MDELDQSLQRNDAIRVLELAIASVGTPTPDAAGVLRNIEEGGYTLRLTTREERAAKRRDLEVETFGSAEAPNV